MHAALRAATTCAATQRNTKERLIITLSNIVEDTKKEKIRRVNKDKRKREEKTERAFNVNLNHQFGVIV